MWFELQYQKKNNKKWWTFLSTEKPQEAASYLSVGRKEQAENLAKLTNLVPDEILYSQEGNKENNTDCFARRRVIAHKNKPTHNHI